MSTERKNPSKRDQALNDATAGQMGEEPGSDINPSLKEYNHKTAERKPTKEEK
jgi:hypothetical protein